MKDQSVIKSQRSEGSETWVDEYLPVPAQFGPPQRSGVQIDISWIRGALFRQRWIVLVTIIAALLIGGVATLLAVPTYQAKANARIAPFGNTILDPDALQSEVLSFREIGTFLQTQIDVIQSRNLAENVARKMNLGNRADFLGPDIEESRPAKISDEEWEESKVRMAAARLRSGVTAAVPNDSYLLEITYTSDDPVFAADAANAYLDAFAEADALRTIESSAYAREYLLEQIDDLRKRLQETERNANDYARKAGIITQGSSANTEPGGGLTIKGSNLTSVNQTYAQARVTRIAAEQKWRAVSGAAPSTLPEVQGDPVYQALTSEKAKITSQLAVLRERYNEQFPEIVDLTKQLGLLDQQLTKVGEDVKGTIRNEYEIALRQERALEQELASVTDQALFEQDKSVEYATIEGDAEALRVQMTYLLDRYNSISSLADAQRGTVTPLDRATVPGSPSSPDIMRNMIISLVLGVVMAGGLGLLREIFVDQFRRAEDVENRLGLPLIGFTPYVKSSDIDNHGANQFDALMESYASIRSTLDYTVPSEGAVIQLTSSQPGEGKSTTALILAELFAHIGRRTLLIDGDLRNPSIAKLLDLDRPPVGLAEVLMGHAAFEDAAIKGIHDNLSILTVAGMPADPANLVSSRRFSDFIAARRAEYSLIIIDSPPLLGIADATEIAQCVDSTILVLEANRTTFAQANTSLRRLSGVGANMIGVVLTKYRALEAGADYGNQYGYYRYGGEK